MMTTLVTPQLFIWLYHEVKMFICQVHDLQKNNNLYFVLITKSYDANNMLTLLTNMVSIRPVCTCIDIYTSMLILSLRES